MDRKEAIEILQREIVCLNHPACIDCPNYKGCDPICTTPYDSEYIEAYKMAIQSLEVDEAYQHEYEKAEEVECVNLEEAIEAIKHAPVNFSIESDIDFSKYKKEIQLIICNIISAQEVAIRKLDKIAVKVGEDA